MLNWHSIPYFTPKNKFKRMKTTFITILALIFSTLILAQNTQTETKTTTSTVKDSKGEHKTVKKEVTKEVQKIKLGEEKSNSSNIPTIDSPVIVTTSTKVTNPDGSTRTVDVDRSAYYESNGKKYKLDLDAYGYIMSHKNTKTAFLRKTSINQ